MSCQTRAKSQARKYLQCVNRISYPLTNASLTANHHINYPEKANAVPSRQSCVKIGVYTRSRAAPAIRPTKAPTLCWLAAPVNSGRGALVVALLEGTGTTG